MPKRQKGKGFMDILSKANNFLKNTKILSTVGSMIPHAGAKTAAGVVGALGYGRRRRPRKTGQKGGFIGPLLSLLGGKKGGARKKVIVT